MVDTPNRDLFVELLVDRGYFIGNTLVDLLREQQVTFREAGVAAMAPVQEDKFAMLDFLLMPSECQCSLAMASSIREAIASDHFLVYFRIRCQYQSEAREQRRGRKGFKAL